MIIFLTFLSLDYVNATSIYRYGFGDIDAGNDAVVDNSGNTYVTGYLGEEIITLKYSAGAVTGALPVWTKIYNPDLIINSEGKK